MIFQFSDGEFSDPIATSLKMLEKNQSVTLEKLNRYPQACLPPDPPPQKKKIPSRILL